MEGGVFLFYKEGKSMRSWLVRDRQGENTGKAVVLKDGGCFNPKNREGDKNSTQEWERQE